MSADHDFEPVVEQIKPTSSKRVRSAIGLILLLVTLGVVAAVSLALFVVLAVIVLNNAL